MSKHNKILFLHIGYPKTGTTTIQQSLFWPLHKSNLLFYSGTNNSSDIETPSHQQNVLESSLYDFVVKNKTPDIDEIKSIANENNKILISREGLTSALISTNEQEPKLRLTDLVSKLRQYSKYIGYDTVKIIITFRKQDEMAHSLFVQGYRLGFKSDFMNFIKRISSSSTLFSQGLHYSEVFKRMTSEFGKDNVHALFYEELQSEPDKFIGHLYEILSVNTAYPCRLPQANIRRIDSNTKHARSYGPLDYLVALKRVLIPNKSFGLYKYFEWLNIYKHQGKAIEFSTEEKSRLMFHYSQSNRELAKMVDKDLRVYGYHS